MSACYTQHKTCPIISKFSIDFSFKSIYNNTSTFIFVTLSSLIYLPQPITAINNNLFIKLYFY